MQYTTIIKVTTLFSFYHIKCSTCHLKDLGESLRNWSSVLENIEKRIVGGTDAYLQQYPYNVQFFNYGGLCGGSILTRKIVLTAAHCFDANTNLADMKIFSKPRFLFDVQAITDDVWDFCIHERYGQEYIFNNDIALIIIHNEFVFNTMVQKVKTADTEIWARENETFIVTGWGESQYGEGVKETVFRETELSYIGREKCMTINNITLGPGMFCLFGDGKRDTCRGDSGGGVLWKGEVVGIVSHGRGCGSMPGMYVNVFYYKSWIDENIERLYKKFCEFHSKRIK